jgi:peptidoglycan hydrolase CwlO-like protein
MENSAQSIENSASLTTENSAQLIMEKHITDKIERKQNEINRWLSDINEFTGRECYSGQIDSLHQRIKENRLDIALGQKSLENIRPGFNKTTATTSSTSNTQQSNTQSSNIPSKLTNEDRISHAERELTSLRQEVGAIQNNINAIRNDVSKLNSDMTFVKSTLQRLIAASSL